MVELLTSRALQWAQAVLKACPDLSYNDFLTKFHCDKGSRSDAATHKMFNLKQGKRRLSRFFHRLLDFGKGDGVNALRGAFLNSLNEKLLPIALIIGCLDFHVC